MTNPQGLFGRISHAIFAPNPPEGQLTMLAKSQPAASAVPIEKSWWKLGFWFGMCLFPSLVAIIAICFGWSSGSIGMKLFFSTVFLLPFLTALLHLRVATCKEPPLVLEPEGLRMNYTGDFVRFDQIAAIEFLSISAGMRLTLAPGVKSKSGRVFIVIAELYSHSVWDLAAEIRRRMKIAALKSS